MEFIIKSAKNNYHATLSFEDGQFVLKAGSTVSASVSSHFKNHKTVEQRRKDAGITEDNLMIAKDLIFKSSSVAGEFVCGSSCNGPSSWKTKEEVTLKEWMAEHHE